jgi:hypothetical protein
MSKRISDAQIYGLMWANENTGFSELHNPPQHVKASDGRIVALFRTAFDRFGLLGLERRRFLRTRGHGLWEITDAGRNELARPVIVRRITAMANETARRQAEVQAALKEM